MNESSHSRNSVAPAAVDGTKSTVQTLLLCGPAGSGKTYHCLEAVKAELRTAPDGPPLIWLAPKQSTFQLERQILADPSIPGYTRLHILSFERLAAFLLAHFGVPAPQLLGEDGRCMVLRNLLGRLHGELHLFRASARLNGFARQLSLALHELQREQLTPESLRDLASKASGSEGVGPKLMDLALLLERYQAWLGSHNLIDAGSLLTVAAEAARAGHSTPLAQSGSTLCASLWVDGFMDWSSQEWDLIEAIIPLCPAVTLTFCLDSTTATPCDWLSQELVVQRNFLRARDRLVKLEGVQVQTKLLSRHPAGRFGSSPVLTFLEQGCAFPQAAPKFTPPEPQDGTQPVVSWIACPDPESEAVCAARIILEHVRNGGRFRDVALLLRDLSHHQHGIERVFSRYGIPFFLDQRESVSHHPLAELTRNALRTVVNGWDTEDWFAALKSGLIKEDEDQIDHLENEALARGWRGSAWKNPLPQEPGASSMAQLNELRERLMPTFLKLETRLNPKGQPLPGHALTGAIRQLWADLDVEDQMRKWAEQEQEQPGARPAGAVHATVWTQMNSWLETVDLAFAAEALPVRDWLPILEAGLAGLSVGVIPPALDQVVVGAIDRSRSLETPIVLLLGMNEGLFPARPQTSSILSEADREFLSTQNLFSAGTLRGQLSRERHMAYLALTRASQRLVLTHSNHADDGTALHPSPILALLQRLFPVLQPVAFSPEPDLASALHPRDILMALRKSGRSCNPAATDQSTPPLPGLESTPAAHTGAPALPPFLKNSGEWLPDFVEPGTELSIPPDLATQLYGQTLRTSVSRLEQFAMCPFRFFAHSGLRAEDRQFFEADYREQGNFQHQVLATFHETIKKKGLEWKSLKPKEARDLIGKIAAELAASGTLWQDTEQNRLLAKILTASLEDFIFMIVEWMQSQYLFQPAVVELPFGMPSQSSPAPGGATASDTTPDPQDAPPWKLQLDANHSLELRGRIDRIDLLPSGDGKSAACVVIDYKSSEKKLERIRIENGLQLQLLGYLNVLRHWRDVEKTFGVDELQPAGAFYVNLQGSFARADNRSEALADAPTQQREAYGHRGRFSMEFLPSLDARPDVKKGDQFNYRLKNDGMPYANSTEIVLPEAFEDLLDSIEQIITEMGRSIFAGKADVSPYRKSKETACDQCSYKSLCRIDPWTHSYRALRPTQ